MIEIKFEAKLIGSFVTIGGNAVAVSIENTAFPNGLKDMCWRYNHCMEALVFIEQVGWSTQCDGPTCYYCDTGIPHPPTLLAEEAQALIAKFVGGAQ